MWAPGIVGLTIGVLLLFFVSDSPEKNGYPPVEVVKQKVSSWKLMLLSWRHFVQLMLKLCAVHSLCTLFWYAQLLIPACGLQKQDTAGKEQKESLLTLLVQNVLKNPYIWGMALTYFFIYVVRQGVTSWFVFYLMKVSQERLMTLPLLACSKLVFHHLLHLYIQKCNGMKLPLDLGLCCQLYWLASIGWQAILVLTSCLL